MEMIPVHGESVWFAGIGRHVKLDISIRDERLGKVDSVPVSVVPIYALALGHRESQTYRSTRIISDLTFDQLPSHPTTISKPVPCSSSIHSDLAFPLASCTVFSKSPPVPWVCDSSCPGNEPCFLSLPLPLPDRDRPYAFRDLKSMRDSLISNRALISDGKDSTRRWFNIGRLIELMH